MSMTKRDAPSASPSLSPRRRATLAVAGLFALAGAAVLAIDLPGAGAQRSAWAAEETPATALDSPADVARALDRILAETWKKEGLTPNKLCTDEEFVRRVHFDIIGTPPTALQVDEFLKDSSPKKREKLVDTLLASPGYARHFANLWAEVLVGVGTGDNNRDYVPSVLMPWLERQIAQNRPWGEVVYELVAASGSPYVNAPVNFSARLAFSPTDLAGITSRAFLGVQIQCAQCHDHPYEDISQADFNGFAAFWGRIRLRPADIPYEMFGPRAVEAEQRRMERDVEAAMKTGIPESEAKILAERKKQRTKDLSDLPGDVKLPKALQEGRQKLLGEASKTLPKFLHGDVYADAKGETRREGLARWIISPTNPYTPRALANRYWGWFFGRGIVHPVDDFSSVNIPSAPAALDLLAKDTADHGYDPRRLIRAITATRAYQTSTASRERSSKSVEFFAAGPLKTLSPQQSFDALNVALGVVPDGRSMTFSAAPISAVEMEAGRPGMRAMEMTGDEASSAAETRARQVLNQAAQSFFRTFDDEEGGGGADFEGTVPQGLFLLNSQVVNGLLSNPRVSILPKVLAEHREDRDRIRHLFLRTLAREPRNDEMERFVTYVRQAGGGTTKASKKGQRSRLNEEAATAPYADVLWVLVSSSEFGSNH